MDPWGLTFPNYGIIPFGRGRDGNKAELYTQLMQADMYPPKWRFKGTQDQTKMWMLANWLMRPPLLDDEIKVMPVREVMTLYYSMNQPTGCDQYLLPNIPAVAAGMPTERYDMGNGYSLVQRIYKLRPELHVVKHPNTKKLYRLLLPMDWLIAPDCGKQELIEGITAAATFVSLVAGGIGGVIGGIIEALAEVASTTVSTLNTVQLQRLSVENKGVASEIATAILIAEATMPPTMTPDQAIRLQQAYANWQSAIDTITPHIAEIMTWWDEVPMPWPVLAGVYYPKLADKSPDYGMKIVDNQKIGGKVVDPLVTLLSLKSKARLIDLNPPTPSLKLKDGRIFRLAGGKLSVNPPPQASMWKPYRPFFYSAAVRKAVMSYQPPQVEQSADQVLTGAQQTMTNPEPNHAAGLGLLLLLLL